MNYDYPHQVACREGDIHKGGVFGDSEGGGTENQEGEMKE